MYPDDGDRGLILEVDLEYPEELHDLQVKVTKDMLSPYCREIINKNKV